MSIADKLVTIAENEQKVYDAGKEQGISEFWDMVQDNGKRQYWQNAFAYWGAQDISPEYLIAPNAQSVQGLFMGATKLKTVDWSKFDLTKCTTLIQAFNSCFELESIDTDLAPTTATSTVWQYTFSGCWAAKRIQKMITQLTHAYTGSFNRCDSLEEIRFAPFDAEKGIGIGNDISFEHSPNLSRESIVSILEALANNLPTIKTLTFSTDLNFEERLKDYVFGTNSGVYMEEETGTINGLEYRKRYDEIILNGTTTAETTINLYNTPIVFPETPSEKAKTMSVQLYDIYNQFDWQNGNYDWLRATVKKSDGQVETIYASRGSIGYYCEGDKITSIDLVIPAGVTFNNSSYIITCAIDYLYWLEEILLYRSCWNLVY